MKLHHLAVGALSAAILVALQGVAEARNPHCAGGIQYFSQALADKQKGNMEDYQREIGKAIAQLGQCSGEDAADYEAIGYLGMAYAEIDSAGPAGDAFEKAIAGMKAKGDKKLDWVVTNQKSYWSLKFNEGITKIQTAQQLYADMRKTPSGDDEKKAHDLAQQNYEGAIASLTRASQLRPNEPTTLANLGVAYALMGDTPKARSVIEAGLKANPNDAGLKERLDQLTRNSTGQLIESGKFDDAIAIYQESLKKNDKDGDAWAGIADAYFKRASGTKEADKKKADYKASGDAYAKAAPLKDGDPDLFYNAAVAYSNAGLPAQAEPMWKGFLEKRADDPEGHSGYGSTLADLGKFTEAAAQLKLALAKKPEELTFHRQLVGIYAKANDSKNATGETFVVMAMSNGKVQSTVGAAAGSAEAQTVTSEGAPEKIYLWEADGQKYETLMYFSKGRAFHFHNGQLVAKSDWTAGGGAATGAKK